MTTFFNGRATIIFVFLLLTMLILTWLFPSSRFMIEATFITVSLALASLVVVVKNRESYQQGNLTKRAFVRRTIFDILSILLSMTLAGLLAHSIAQNMMASVGSGLTRIGVVIVISLLAGVSIGILMKRIRRYVVATIAK
jgi:cobalamin synthase